jgi:hypothetical protein
MLLNFIQWLLSTLPSPQTVKDIAIALIGAGAGAWGGALGAQRIADRGKLREGLLKQIRSVNVAIDLASLIATVFLNLKEQHVRGMKQAYDAKYEEFKRRRVDRRPYELAADFEVLAPVSVPVEQLQAIVFGELSFTAGRPIVLAPTLAEVVRTTNTIISERNRLIEEFRSNRRSDDMAQLLSFYFGVPDAHNNIDKRYANTIEGLYSNTDHCIAFASMLIKDLGIQGEALKKRFDARFRKKAPMIHKPLFDKAQERGLMPDQKEYAAWDHMFVQPTTDHPAPSRLQRFQRSYLRPLFVWRIGRQKQGGS